MTERSLSFAEFAEAAFVGVLRQTINRMRGVADRFGFDGDPWGVHIEGACAEKLVAKQLGLYWVGALDHKDEGSDVGGYGVRHTARTNGSLLLHPSDKNEQIFYLVVGTAPYQEIAGWISAAEGKQAKYWREDVRHPCFFVPQSALRDVTEATAQR